MKKFKFYELKKSTRVKIKHKFRKHIIFWILLKLLVFMPRGQSVAFRYHPTFHFRVWNMNKDQNATYFYRRMVVIVLHNANHSVLTLTQSFGSIIYMVDKKCISNHYIFNQDHATRPLSQFRLLNNKFARLPPNWQSEADRKKEDWKW